MASSAQELRAARAKQLQADVLVHEAYSGGSNMSAGSHGSSSSDFKYIPNEAEMEHYTRLLNNPGEIMPHGVVFLLNESNRLNIMACSNNTETFFGKKVEDLIGTSVLNLFEQTQRIEAALAMKNMDLANPITLSIKKEHEDDVGGTVNMILHRGPSGLLADVEPLDPSENSFAAHQRVRVAIERLGQMNSIESMCEQVCEDVYNILGYDRVMVYHFHEDCHGEVMAERKADHVVDSYLGLHYPATDLPQRIRDQYISEHVRMIVDVNVEHSRILTEDPELEANTILLSGSTLRRAHKCHIEYLVNMGVAASIGLAIVVKDHLWGLIIAHHQAPKFVSYQMRMAGDLLAQAFSMRVSSIADMEAHKRHNNSLQMHEKLCDMMLQQGFNPGLRLRGLICGTPNLTNLVPSVKGAAVYYGGKKWSAGEVPADDQLQKVIDMVQDLWLSSSSGRQVKAVESLAELDESFEEFAHIAAGMICVPVLEDGMLLMFRPEIAASIRWGGNPNKPALMKKTGAMHPRASFEIFTDSVKNRCTPWLKWQVEIARGLGQLVNDIIKSRDQSGSDILGRVADSNVQTQNETQAVLTEMTHLMDSVKAPVLAVDKNGILVQFNSMCCTLTGYARNEVLGKPLIQIVAEPFRKDVSKIVQKVVAGEITSAMELSIVKARAAELPAIARKVDLLLNASARYDASGICVGVNCVCEDITTTNLSKNKTEQFGQQFEQIARLAAQLQPNAIDATENNFEFDPDGDKEEALLGEGAFGKTYRMKSELDGVMYAVKMINVKRAQKNGLPVDALKREVHMLLKLNDPYIVRYYTCFLRKKGKYFCIVMELAEGGTLGDLLKNADGINEAKIRRLMSQVAKGLDHIHSKKMLHRDLKPDNVLLSSDGQEAKITDFGLACVLSSSVAGARAGTLTYASPEKVGSKQYDHKDDMWALGCILSELVTGVAMQHRCSGGVFALNQGLIKRTVDECKEANAKLGAIVEMLLSVNPAQRPSAAEVAVMLDLKEGAGKAGALNAQELCEEYLCSSCQGLVVDAHTCCREEHIFCCSCLLQALDKKKECPVCNLSASEPKRMRVINNVVDKLAARVLSDEERAAREEGKRKAADSLAKAEAAKAAAQDAVVAEAGMTWLFAHGTAQFGSACTLMQHNRTKTTVEVFHETGWFRFRLAGESTVRWCNSCGIIGESDFGAPDILAVLDGGGGELIPANGITALSGEEFWKLQVMSTSILLTNEDDEALVLKPDGTFVWLSNPSMEKGLVVREGGCGLVERAEARELLGDEFRQTVPHQAG